MTSSSTVLASAAAAARIALAEAVVLKVGQVLQAIVGATDSDGLTTLKLGDETLQAQLPQPLPAGTTLQLQVKAGGPTRQLAIVAQSPPAGQASAPAATVRTVTAPVPPMPRSAAPQVIEQLPGPIAQPPAAETTVASTNPGPGAAGVGTAAAQMGESGQAVATPSSQTESAAAPPSSSGAAPAPPSPAPPATLPASQAAAGEEAAPVDSIVLPAGISPAGPAPVPVASQAAPPVAAVVEVEQATTTAILGSPLMPAAEGSPVPPQSGLPPAPLQAPAVVPGPAGPPSTETISAPAVGGTPLPTTQIPGDADPEPKLANPLLLAQSAARPVAATGLPQAFVPVATTAARAVGPAPAPPTPAAALAQMVPEALSRQGSAAPLLQTLADVVVRLPNVLPEPVLRAAMGMLAQRIVSPDGRVSARAIEEAVTRSGIGLEASLARGTPQPMDAKAGLLALRDALTKWLGDAPPLPPQGRAPSDTPPLKGLPLRAVPADPPPLPDAPRDAGRLLHQETDSAISRLKLMQLASLPDAGGNPARPASLRMELPFLIGHELVMAQMQIGRDLGGSRRDAAGKRGWSMRFALNFSATGEVGAEVGLLDKAVSVSLWAAEPETAAAMRETLPELKEALEGIGLLAQGLRIRGGVPEPERPASGKILDNVS